MQTEHDLEGYVGEPLPTTFEDIFKEALHRRGRFSRSLRARRFITEQEK